MTDLEKFKLNSTFSIDEFPDYTCYLLEPITFCIGLTQNEFDHSTIQFRYGYKWSPRFLKSVSAIDKCASSFGQFSTSFCDEHDRLLVHPESKLPRTLISLGSVYNERSPLPPTKVVVPYNYPTCLFRKMRRETNVILLVNEYAKIVFAVSHYTTESEVGGSEQQWRYALHNSNDIEPEFSNVINGVTMPFGTKCFTLVEDLSDLDKCLISGMIPNKCIVHEHNVEVGTDEPTVDMLYSAYLMMQSPDSQIVETSFNMLARSKFGKVRYIIRWLLRGNDAAIYYRHRSTSFKWMYTVCCDRTNFLALPDDIHKNTAIELIRKITKNGIDFDGTKMIVNDSKWLQDDKIRLLASKI